MIATTQKATREQTKRHNKRLILKLIYDLGLISRAEIARTTHLTATTVSTAIGELIAEGLVEEVGSISTERGKPPTLLRLVKDSRYVLALDLSRNVFRGGVLNLRGEILHRQEAPLGDQTSDQALNLVYQVIDSLLSRTNGPLLGIGIGAPGIIDLQQGFIHQAVNLGWQKLPLGDLVSQRYTLSTHIVNDNQAALLAEHLFGKYKNLENLVVIRIGHGIGAGVMLNGQLLSTYGVGEIGHVTVVEHGDLCSCGNWGCLETVASNRAIVRQARLIAQKTPTSLLNQQASVPESITIESILQAFAAGDASLLPLVQDVGHYLGIAIANLIGVLGMSQILLAGRVARFGQPLLEVIEREVCRHSLTARLHQPKIDLVTVTSDISDLIMLGAAASLLTNHLGLF